jgi:hypothetical protein
MAHLSVRSRVRSMIGEIVRLRQEADPGSPPVSRHAGRDREIVALADELNVHVVWMQYEEEGGATPVCVCGWHGTLSDDITERSFESIGHTMSEENF